MFEAHIKVVENMDSTGEFAGPSNGWQGRALLDK
jgi:hypothetical protein